jgi:hypothetical protein
MFSLAPVCRLAPDLPDLADIATEKAAATTKGGLTKSIGVLLM